MKNLLFILLNYSLFCSNAFCQNEQINKQVVYRYFDEVVNKQKIELLNEIYAQDYLYKSLANGYERRGIKPHYDFLVYLFKAFPDIHFSVDQIVVEGDKIAVQTTAKGTHKAEFIGYAASNNKISVTEIFFYTVKDGIIIESKNLLDEFNLIKQLKGEK